MCTCICNSNWITNSYSESTSSKTTVSPKNPKAAQRTKISKRIQKKSTAGVRDDLRRPVASRA